MHCLPHTCLRVRLGKSCDLLGPVLVLWGALDSHTSFLTQSREKMLADYFSQWSTLARSPMWVEQWGSHLPSHWGPARKEPEKLVVSLLHNDETGTFDEVFCHLSLFCWFVFLSWHVCYLKGRSLGCSPGWGNAGGCAVTLYVGKGLRRSNGACSTLHQISDTPSATHNQIGPLWCWFPSGWACARSRPLWVSPTTSPVRLGVSPAAAPTPTGVFNQRFEALFPRAGALGCEVCFDPPPFLPVYLCVNVGRWGLLAVALPAR